MCSDYLFEVVCFLLLITKWKQGFSVSGTRDQIKIPRKYKICPNSDETDLLGCLPKFKADPSTLSPVASFLLILDPGIF